MPELSFRDATVDDLPGIVAMYADDELGCSREDPSATLTDRYRRAFEEIDADACHRLIVAGRTRTVSTRASGTNQATSA